MEAARGPQDSSDDRRKRAGTHSGRLLLRMPEELHAELARVSERAGVSLNSYINDALTEAVGRGPSQSRPPARARQPERRARRRFVERLLAVNLVVVAAVGALVVVLLVQTIR